MNGQLGIETMAAIAIVLILFFSVNALTGIKQSELNNLETNLKDKVLCDKVSAIINSIQSNPGTETTITLDKEVHVLNGEIEVGEWNCIFFGQSQDKNLSGTIRVYGEGGVIKFEEIQ